MILKKG
jgi:hypothetical protein